MAKKMGMSNTKPKNEATPLGTSKKRPSSSKKTADAASTSAAADSVVEKTAVDQPKEVDSSVERPADSSSNTLNADHASTPSTDTRAEPAPVETTTMAMTVTKSAKQRKSRDVFYDVTNGVRGSVRVSKSLFPKGEAPASISLESPTGFAEPKRKLTAEERKAARANAPKLTPAQKLAKLQERANKLQAKLAAEQAKLQAAASTAQTGEQPQQTA